ncbi:aldo/keto reductase [Klebsiella pneumoniae]
MNYTHLGRTGLKVSRLCLGTMNFGDVTDEKTSARILDEALEAGINFIDTADVYGTEQSPDIQQGSGLSEEIIGRWLQQGGRRERIVLATKVYQPMGPGPNDRRLSAYHIRKACEDSLRRLKTDHIDVYQMHHIDRHTPWEEIWQAMELLVQQGKVLYIGSSNFAGWDIATAQSVATARHFLGLVAEQSLYNLTARTIELEVIPACRHFGLGLIPWSPLAGGLLGGVLKKMVSPNVGSIHAILPGLAVGNGIAIDPAGSQIWATEHAKNRLHRVRLSDATTVAPFGSVVTYQFTGPAPDGARVDSEGNVYVAISGQGRVMVFNRNGLPIGQIVLPDRDKGRNLKSTSLAIRPGHRELFIVANSGTEPGGAMIFRSGAFAPAPFPFSHQ